MKRRLYLLLSAILGLIFSLGLHGLIELWYLSAVDPENVTWKNLSGATCALPWWLLVGLPLAGLVSGWLIGRLWWRWVYIEHRHWRRRSS